eukprot:scaffold1248_cov122-Isochrysis_galbana.AAC.14
MCPVSVFIKYLLHVKKTLEPSCVEPADSHAMMQTLLRGQVSALTRGGALRAVRVGGTRTQSTVPACATLTPRPSLVVLQHVAAFASPAPQHVHCADALNADSSVNTRTMNDATSDNATKQRIDMDPKLSVESLMKFILASMGGLFTSGVLAVIHFDNKIDRKMEGLGKDVDRNFEGLGRDVDRKFEGVDRKIEGLGKDVDRKIEGLGRDVHDLKVLVERQRAFDEGRRSWTWWSR